MIYYLLQSSLVLGILLAVYFILLKNEKAFMLNRFYLIFSVLFSLSIPSLQISKTPIAVEPVIAVLKATDFTDSINESIPYSPEMEILNPTHFTWLDSILLIYLAVSIVFIGRYIFNVYRLKKLSKNKGPILSSMQTVLIDYPSKPFSFFNLLFISRESFDDIKQNESIVFHEQAHSQQLHSLDILIIEFIKCILWFNPLIWIYKKEISENHEYLADKYAATKQNNANKYALNIIDSMGQESPVPLTSGFGYILIKKRIKMLNQSKKSVMSTLIKLIPGLLIALMVIGLSAFKLQTPPTVISENSTVTTKANTPNISPIKQEDLTKVASGYGMRTHPTLKIEKMHTGVDFTAPEGTLINATADGEVIFSSFLKGYGNHVIIKHDNTYQTLYAHMSTLMVTQGQKVKSGQVIGVIGNSGKSIATHLHYEVIKNGNKVNPHPYLNN